MLRKTIFWMHLIAGVTVGIVVFMMSATGVILMYERQLRAWVAESHYVPVSEQAEPLSLEALLQQTKIRQPTLEVASLVLSNDPGAPVELRAGRRERLAVNPYSSERMETQSPGLEKFLSTVTGLHRWFNIQGEGRAMARQITGISNVAFLFLVLSGIYLWLPKLWRWAQFKVRLLFRGDYPTSKARDFHWHHIFGIWAAIPLVAVVYSGMVISYPWAANFMYRVFGAEIPVETRGAPPAQAGQPVGAGSEVGRRESSGGGSDGSSGGGSVGSSPAREARNAPVEAQGSVPVSSGLPLATFVEKAITHSQGDWQRLTLTLPRGDADTVQIEVDQGNGAQAHKRYTLSLARTTGEVTSVRTFADTPEAQRLRGITRFLHTGEVLGFWGQTIAGLACFAALFMVWTGFALSWRRLIQPLFKRNLRS
jgi:uncharacterized iron-regulated membrane protein